VNTLSWTAAAFFLYAASAAVRLITAEIAPAGEAQRWLGSAPNAEYETEPTAEEDALQKAARLKRALTANPRKTWARIELGLLWESEGKTEKAEDCLLEAARTDHQQLAAWTLANFYFRHEKQDDFWHWARETVRLNFDDVRPLLRLAYAVDPDPRFLVGRLGEGVAYPLLDVLLEKDRMDKSQELARMLMARPAARRETILDLSTRQIAHRNASWALELWNWLGPPADPLARPPDGQGFRPRLETNPGVQTEWTPGRIVFRFDGTESDTLPLLEQAVAAPASAVRYRLLFEFSGPTEGLDFSLGSRVRPLGRGARPAPGPLVSFSLPADHSTLGPMRIVPFRLYYRRTPGVPPLQGELTLGHLQLIQEEP